MSKVLVLPGDGIGPEIVKEAVKVLDVAKDKFGLDVELDEALVGGAAVDAEGDPLPESTLNKARAADAILFGSIGGPKWDTIERDKRPERGLLRLRSSLAPSSLAVRVCSTSACRASTSLPVSTSCRLNTRCPPWGCSNSK